MNMISRRLALRALGLVPAAAVAGTPALAAAQDLVGTTPDELRARAEWHFAELVNLLDRMEPGELHVVLQRTRDAQS
jgi:hypothetical protein